MIKKSNWILLAFTIYCWTQAIASNITVESNFSVDNCKQLLICCGDSTAYTNLGQYEFDEFDIGAQFYYQLLVACKFPNTSRMSCALAENKLANYMYHTADAFRAMDSICRKTSLVLLEEGINRKDWCSAYFAYQFYATAEADSSKAIDNLKLSYSPDFRQIKDSIFIAYKIEEAKIRWQQQYKNIVPAKPSTPYIAIFETDSLRHAIRCDGDTIAYNKLIESSRLSKNQYAFNECLYDAILMLCFYNYAPAKKHVYEILQTFYTEDETPSQLYLKLLDIFISPQYAGYYGYDGNGERVYKLTGTSSISQLNSGKQEVSIYFDDLAVYPNPYMVVTPRGYTKHYYAESERLATVTGMGGFGDIIAPINNEDDHVHHDLIIVDSFYSRYEEQYPFGYLDTTEMIHPLVDIDWRPTLKLDYYTCAPASLSHVGIAADIDMLYHPVYEYIDSLGIETEIYFYHGDHLGSASWITNQTGKPIQYLHYAPYGELIVNETLDGYDERYKFTGKERDEESGYDYYGARFYWHLLGIWLSVDPMVDKYLWINPYAFCAWNPVKYLDPNGRYFTRYHLWKASRYVKFLRKKYEKAESSADKENIIKLMQSIGDMKKDTENEYRFWWRPIIPSVTRGHGRNKDGKVIVEMIYSTENKPHEVTHGGQVAQNRLECTPDGGIQGYDMGDEIEAYQNQISASGSCQFLIYEESLDLVLPVTINSADAITPELIRKISDDYSGNSRPYMNLPNAE